MESISRRRAKHVWDRLNTTPVSPALVTLAKGFPVLVRGHGLAVAVALTQERARGGGSGGRANENAVILAFLEDWLLKGCPLDPFGKGSDARASGGRGALLEACMTSPSVAYLAAQGEALSYLEQLKLIVGAVGEDR